MKIQLKSLQLEIIENSQFWIKFVVCGEINFEKTDNVQVFLNRKVILYIKIGNTQMF